MSKSVCYFQSLFFKIKSYGTHNFDPDLTYMQNFLNINISCWKSIFIEAGQMCLIYFPGSKDGTIKAWNTTMQRFPLFGSFQGKSVQNHEA